MLGFWAVLLLVSACSCGQGIYPDAIVCSWSNSPRGLQLGFQAQEQSALQGFYQCYQPAALCTPSREAFSVKHVSDQYMLDAHAQLDSHWQMPTSAYQSSSSSAPVAQQGCYATRDCEEL